MTHSPATSEDEERHSASECPEGGSESDSSPDGPGRGPQGTRGRGSGAPGNLASTRGLQGRSMSVPDDAHFSMMVFRIGIPDLHQTKCLRFNPDATIWTAKQQVLCALSESLQDVLNYGLFQPATSGRDANFLEEERLLREYPQSFEKGVPYLEFRYKTRVYKQTNLDEKQLAKLHTKTGLKKFLEYVQLGTSDKVARLLDKGLDPNYHDSDSGETPLTLAAQTEGSVEVIRTLCLGGAHIDFRARDGMTALHKAACARHCLALTALLDLGGSPNYKDRRGLTPLFHPLPDPPSPATPLPAAPPPAVAAAPPTLDSTASSLTSYDSEVATLTQGAPAAPGDPPAPGPPAPAAPAPPAPQPGPDPPPGTDSGIEEVDSRSSSDHPLETISSASTLSSLSAEGGGNTGGVAGGGAGVASGTELLDTYVAYLDGQAFGGSGTPGPPYPPQLMTPSKLRGRALGTSGNLRPGPSGGLRDPVTPTSPTVSVTGAGTDGLLALSACSGPSTAGVAGGPVAVEPEVPPVPLPTASSLPRKLLPWEEGPGPPPPPLPGPLSQPQASALATVKASIISELSSKQKEKQ